MPDTNQPDDNINEINVNIAKTEEGDDSEYEEIELSEDLQKILFYSIDEAINHLENEDTYTPFTVTLAGEDVFLDKHDGEEVEDCFKLAKDAVNLIAHIADAYVFCYDGYIELEDGTESDMIISELGVKGDDSAKVFGLMYRYDENGQLNYDEALVDLGLSDNLFDPEAVAEAEAMASIYSEEEGDADGEGSGEESSEEVSAETGSSEEAAGESDAGASEGGDE